ncbi:hypothetical protein AWZ03_014488 [Drosophila navojoa]|uniref:DUF4774 domain-containing protein n=1 Tax=Drosophila navojoa TaxID=7232 RepID=A0A484ARB0_DRONA|nr:hypothetical protein AWZ03_014488 [Drosophila navojoa]
MLRVQGIGSLLLALAVIGSLGVGGVRAASLGRERRVQTSSTSMGPTQRSGEPMWQTTFDSNDVYIETPLDQPNLRRAALALLQQQKKQQQQQAKQFTASAYAEEQHGKQLEQAEPDYAELAELAAGQRQPLLLVNVPAVAARQSPGNVDESRRFHFLKRHKWDLPEKNGTLFWVNNTNINAGPTEAPPEGGQRYVIREIVRSPQVMPMPMPVSMSMPVQYFETRQGQQPGLALPYNLIDYGSAQMYGNGVSSANVFAGYNGLNRLSGLGGAVPLVPVSLGNNAVGYVPLNLRMLRQLTAGAGADVDPLAVREGDDDASLAIDALDADQPKSSADAALPSTDSPKMGDARFPLLGQRLRQRQAVAAVTESRNPLAAFAKSIRRIQYL